MAAKLGLFPRSRALTGGLVLLAAAGVLALVAEDAGRVLVALVSRGIDAAVADRPEPGSQLLATLGDGFTGILVPLCVTVFVAASIGALVPAFSSRRFRGRTAVPLPPEPKERIAMAALNLFGILLAGVLAIYVMRDHTRDLSQIARGELNGGISLFKALPQLLAVGGFVMLLVGLAELAIRKRAIWHALHLSSLEARREERAAGGDGAAKREGMRRARREVAQ